jgi:membrane associated rhomboid family serine protease
MKDYQKNAIKTILLISAACAIAVIFSAILSEIIGSRNSMLNPIFSGLLHASFPHFFTNIFFIFIFLLPDVNRDYDFKKIYWITFLLSIFYLPISVLEITLPAIGISGTWFFLMGRFFFSWKNKYNWGLWIAGFIVMAELSAQINNPEDKIAHIAHLMGMAFGYFSLSKENEIFSFPIYVRLSSKIHI